MKSSDKDDKDPLDSEPLEKMNLKTPKIAQNESIFVPKELVSWLKQIEKYVETKTQEGNNPKKLAAGKALLSYVKAPNEENKKALIMHKNEFYDGRLSELYVSAVNDKVMTNILNLKYSNNQDYNNFGGF